MANLSIQFLDVGQGDGIYIEFPNGVNMLVDLGSNKGKRVTGPDIYKYFAANTRFKKTNQTLNYLFITHGDGDHYNMIENFLKNFSIKVENYTCSGIPSDYSGDIISNIHTKYGGTFFTFRGFPAEITRSGGFGNAQLFCLSCNCTGPNSTRNAWTKNSDSIVLQIVYAGIKVMLAGDATTVTEKFILSTMSRYSGKPLESNILKVGHHGSARTSNSKEWVAAVNPGFLFISADRHGSSGEDAATGFRLPQELTLDIFRKYSSRIFNGTRHTYVSAYDPQDYKDHLSIDSSFTDPHATQPDPLNPFSTKWDRGWKPIQTTEAIFTTITSMGGAYTDDKSEADVGSQYQILINERGDINITCT